ncbi:MAG: alpha/beta hydrolase [Chlorobi bacterium]|nr:alpha/beta hydrolase [Chlorobiota bacterium]
MMVLYSLTVAVVLIAILLFITVNSFKNPAPKNDKSPADEGIGYEEVLIPTKNKKKIYSWWIASGNSDVCVILMHGWGKNASLMMPYIKNLHAKGLNLIAFDSRNHGDSDKDGHSSMIKFAEDISACVDYIKANKKAESGRVYLIGLSIGGTASIYAASVDDRISKIVTVGAPSNPADVMRKYLREKRIPNIMLRVVFKYLEFRVGKKFKEICAAANIAKTKATVLLIHGTDDKLVPLEQARLILGASNKNQAQLWEIPGKGHNNCHYEKGFWDRVLLFFEK